MRLHQVVASFAFACGLLSSYAAAQQTESAACPLAVVPMRVGGLDLIGWEKFPTADLGAVFRYRAVNSFGGDVYLYPTKGSSPDQEIAPFKEGLEVYRKRGDFESFNVESDKELTTPDVQVKGRQVIVTMRRGNQAQRSHFYIYPLSGNQYLKVRMTHPEGRFTDDVLQRFVEELVTTMAKRTPAS